MPRVIFLNRYFFPDHSATSQVLGDLAFALAAAGHDVHVIASRQSYDNPTTQLQAHESIRGVTVHRVRTSRFGRSHLLGRSIDYLSFYFSARRALADLVSAGDLVVTMTDPPLLSLAVLTAVKRKRARLINWLQDLYPEVAIASGMTWLKGPAGRVLLYLRDRSLKAASANVVVGRRMAERLAARGISAKTIYLISNFAADDQIVPVPHAENSLRKDWGLDEKFVVGYSGNLGRVHEFETILSAAQRLKDDPRILFLCIGGGAMFDRLSRAAREHGLQSKFLFHPYQLRDNLKYSLSAADVHWLSIRPEFEGLVVPSKFYGIAAVGRPVIAISARDGEIAQLVRGHGCGVVIEPGDAQSLAASLIEFADNRSLCDKMGANARTMLDRDFTRARAVNLWHELIGSIQHHPQDICPGQIQ